MENIEKTFEWNKIAGNDESTYNRHLEVSMLMEEMSELTVALKDKDRTEILDAYCDIKFVLEGTMMKLGFTPSDLDGAMKEVIRSNFSKFTKDPETGKLGFKKDETGKILKPETFSSPNLEKFI